MTNKPSSSSRQRPLVKPSRNLFWVAALVVIGLAGVVLAALQVLADEASGLDIASGAIAVVAIGLLLYREWRRVPRLIHADTLSPSVTEGSPPETLLGRQEDDYRQHLENTPDAIAIHGEKGVLYVNPAALHLMRTDSPDPLLGHSVLEFAHPDSVDVIRQRIHYMKTEGRKVGAMEEKLIRLDGEVAEVEVSAMPVNFESQPAIQITLRDITERKRIEAAQRASEEKFSRVFRAAPIAISISTLEEGRFIDLNQSMIEVLEFEDRDEVIGRTATELNMWVTDRSRDKEVDRLLDSPGILHGHEFQVRTQTGRVIDTIGSVELIEVDGTPCVLTMLLDVTQRKESEARIAALKSFYENILDEIPLQVAALDAEGRFLYSNPAAIPDDTIRTQILEKTSVDLAQLSGYDPEPFVIRHAWLLDAVARKKTSRVEETITTRHGKEHCVERVVRPVLDRKGNVLYLIGYGLDITERKADAVRLKEAKEQAEEMAQLKTAFLSNMSHEIRTPLTGIIGFASVLADELEDERSEMANLIRQSGERLLETLNSVLDLARIEANVMDVASVEVDLRTEIREAVAAFSHIAQRKGIDLDLIVPPDIARVSVDPSFLQRVLANLISNAIKFTEDGKVVVSLESAGADFLLRVEDTGIGIAESFLPHLFDEFRQESFGLARSHTGSGLGLAITKRLVEYLDGSIEVSSTKGEGTCFTVRLPRAVAVEEPVATH